MKPITLPSQSTRVRADRQLVFDTITNYENMELEGYSSKILEDHGDRKLVEFHTPLKIRNNAHVVRSVEWVQLKEPERVDFSIAPGHQDKSIFELNLLDNSLILQESDGCTDITFESRFAIKTPIIGGIVARMLMVNPMRQQMSDHLEDIKTHCEAKAAELGRSDESD